MLRQYRAETNVVQRPPGRGISILGQHELMLPLLRMALLCKLAGSGLEGEARMNPHDLERLVANLGHPRVLIVGDLILDRYVTRRRRAHLARGADPDPDRAPQRGAPGRRGQRRRQPRRDAGGGRHRRRARATTAGAAALRALLEEQKIETSGCVLDASRPTIQKTRMMSGSHQMLRVDNEDARPIRGEALAAVLKILPERVRRAQAVVLSDYGKGLLTPEVIRCAIDSARAAGVPVLVDPKGEDYARYRGATLVTPNRKEAEQALGQRLPRLEDVQRGASELMKLAGLDAAVITLGADGIYFTDKKGESGHVPARARAVFDVTGAGDTVIAQLGLYFAAGVELGTAVFLANQAAAIVVARLGTHAVDAQRAVRARCARSTRTTARCCARRDELDRQLAAWRKDEDSASCSPTAASTCCTSGT